MTLNHLTRDQARFVVLYHQPGAETDRTGQPHLDWMFEWDGRLRTWATPPIDLASVSNDVETDCELLREHRIAYLDYEGEISGSRGTVTQLATGRYRLIEDREDRFRAALRWAHDGCEHTAEIEIYCSFFREDTGRLEESRESWRFRFSIGR